MDERWLPITDGYEVSDLGRVRSWHKTHGRRNEPVILTGTLRKKDGYHTYQIGPDRQRFYGHDLVLRAFVGPPPPNHEVAHNNGVRNDNKLSNLRWATSKENHADRRTHGSALSHEKIAEVLSHRGKTYREIASLTGVSLGAAHSIIQAHEEPP